MEGALPPATGLMAPSWPESVFLVEKEGRLKKRASPGDLSTPAIHQVPFRETSQAVVTLSVNEVFGSAQGLS